MFSSEALVHDNERMLGSEHSLSWRPPCKAMAQSARGRSFQSRGVETGEMTQNFSPWETVEGFHLEGGESEEEHSADADLVDKVAVPGLDALPHVVHDVHLQVLNGLLLGTLCLPHERRHLLVRAEQLHTPPRCLHALL